ncbi:expressed unknown protein [Seminavis robusta]|uniref:Uncharacterized protein n=1 Tax=Seminavis robusta TaxID=568900 RepID=A0A9N8D9S3_9STRA|nr:expressed unknown protein [Seminavis robusta]|eukprot:Sro26_g017780.1 n/a (431) ;mRNA; f:125268-126560
MMSAESPSRAVPESVLLSFFAEATKALNGCSTLEPLSLSQCREKLLEEQNHCLEKVLGDHNASHDDDIAISKGQLQEALTDLSTRTFGSNTGLSEQHDNLLPEAIEAMTDAARLAFARLTLTSECLRTGTTSLNDSPKESANAATPPRTLKTSQLARSDMLEFCALCRASIRLPTVLAHIKDPKQPLLEEANQTKNAANDRPRLHIPPLKRLENLQRLLLQALGYDADMGLTELARQVRMGDGNDDIELVQVIQQTNAFILQTILGDSSNHGAAPLLSDQDQGGVTRVVSVQHSEAIVQLGDPSQEEATIANGVAEQVSASVAPRSQSMRAEEELVTQQQSTFSMAQKAAALRQSLVQELEQMSEQERGDLLQQAEIALFDFQEKAMQIPAGPERIAFLTSMDAPTQRLLAMHRIWQEQVATQASNQTSE